ncbi:MAG: hypothetical protein R2873_09515 [Caldilineaceae bacterium]
MCNFNILHICDYEAGYDDLTTFLDYLSHGGGELQPDVGPPPTARRRRGRHVWSPLHGRLGTQGRDRHRQPANARACRRLSQTRRRSSSSAPIVPSPTHAVGQLKAAINARTSTAVGAR